MSAEVVFKDRVAIVTGAGAGLGRAYALDLAQRGVAVVVNDLGGSVDGVGGNSAAAEAVVAEITEAGGTAMANGANVTDPEQVEAMTNEAIAAFGKVDILINNAGILRDKSFSKMTLDDFRAVLDVHLMGSVICTKAVWDHMKENGYGRVAMTTSSSGLYGNFGQSNYGAAKMGLIGLMNVLAIEGAKNDIRVNAIAPAAATRMTESLLPPEASKLLTTQSVAAGMVALVQDDAPNRMILAAGAGGYAVSRILETQGVSLPPDLQTAEEITSQFSKMADMTDARELKQGAEQTMHFAMQAAQHG